MKALYHLLKAAGGRKLSENPESKGPVVAFAPLYSTVICGPLSAVGW
jgi:hypothetical protein